MMTRKDIKPGAILRVNNAVFAVEPHYMIHPGTRWDVVHPPRKLMSVLGHQSRLCYVALRRGKVQREVTATQILKSCSVMGQRKEQQAVKLLSVRPTAWDFVMRDD